MREERQSSTAVLWKHLATESWHQETNLQTNMIKRETHIWNSLVLSLTQLFILVTIKTKQQVFISTTAYADFTQHSQILHACQTDTHTGWVQCQQSTLSMRPFIACYIVYTFLKKTAGLWYAHLPKRDIPSCRPVTSPCSKLWRRREK